MDERKTCNGNAEETEQEGVNMELKKNTEGEGGFV
jgi:hypothetical protein